MKLRNKVSLSLAIAAIVAIPGLSFAQVASGLGVGMTTPASVAAGSTNVAIANINLSATGTAGDTARIASIPVAVSFGGGANASSLENCRIVNTGTGASLTTGNNVLVGLLNGTNIFVLDTPLVVGNGTSTNVSLVCNVTADVSPTGTITVSVLPSSFVPNSVTTSAGGAISPTTGTTSTGSAAMTSGTVAFTGGTGATTGTGTTDPGTTPGLPNTGSGDGLLNTAFLLASLAVIGSGVYLLKRNYSTK
ncbi:MAG: hypothetical protein JWN37_572 [Candidatus Nomurabacteria bacterium]|nr:hypothetical protein [Candidatus Nomurabacteria bacterium]